MVYFISKNLKLEKFRSVLQGNMMVNLILIGIFHCHLEYFMAIWHIMWAFLYIFPVLVCCTKKNLATLLDTETRLFIEKFLFQALPPKGIFYQDFFESFFFKCSCFACSVSPFLL
jgi:hypothetical membrane protein